MKVNNVVKLTGQVAVGYALTAMLRIGAQALIRNRFYPCAASAVLFEGWGLVAFAKQGPAHRLRTCSGTELATLPACRRAGRKASRPRIVSRASSNTRPAQREQVMNVPCASDLTNGAVPTYSNSVGVAGCGRN